MVDARGAPGEAGASHPLRGPGLPHPLPCPHSPNRALPPRLRGCWPVGVGPQASCGEGPFPQADLTPPPSPGPPGESAPDLTGSEPSTPRWGRFKAVGARKAPRPTGDPVLQHANSPLSQEVSWSTPTPLKGREPHGGNAVSHSTPENYERETQHPRVSPGPPRSTSCHGTGQGWGGGS